MTLDHDTRSLRKAFHESKDRAQAVKRWFKLMLKLEGEKGVEKARKVLGDE